MKQCIKFKFEYPKYCPNKKSDFFSLHIQIWMTIVKVWFDKLWHPIHLDCKWYWHIAMTSLLYILTWKFKTELHYQLPSILIWVFDFQYDQWEHIHLIGADSDVFQPYVWITMPYGVMLQVQSMHRSTLPCNNNSHLRQR